MEKANRPDFAHCGIFSLLFRVKFCTVKICMKIAQVKYTQILYMKENRGLTT